jgi:hypothetical protein
MLELYPNGTIGYSPIHHNELFSGSDTLENYQKKLQSETVDWYYRDKKISYVRNSLGHRCIDISELDFDNYILFAGCSHTEGIGLELEKTYPYILSKKLECDYYNLSLGGTGIDAMIHNLTVWISRYKKPKLLVVQLPHALRAITISHHPLMGTINIHDDNHIEFLLSGDKLNYFNSVLELAKIKINSYNIETYYIDATGGKNILEHSAALIKFDNARDNHLGIKSHSHLSEKLHNQILLRYDKYIDA